MATRRARKRKSPRRRLLVPFAVSVLVAASLVGVLWWLTRPEAPPPLLTVPAQHSSAGGEQGEEEILPHERARLEDVLRSLDQEPGRARDAR